MGMQSAGKRLNKACKNNHLPVKWTKSIVREFCEVPLSSGSKYQSVEIQRVERNGKSGLVSIIHVGPGVIDVVFERELALDQSWAITEPATAHMNVRQLAPSDFSPASYSVSASGVSIDVGFKHSDGAHIEFSVQFEQRKKPRRFFVPAPPQARPKSLRFLILDTFYLLPTASSRIEVKVNSQPQKISYFLLPRLIAPYTATRCGSDMLLTSLDETNRDAAGEMRVSEGDLFMELIGFPHTNYPHEGSGSLKVESSVGLLAEGVFHIRSDGTTLFFDLSIRQDWKPEGFSLARRALSIARRKNRANENWTFCARGESTGSCISFSEGKWVS